MTNQQKNYLYSLQIYHRKRVKNYRKKFHESQLITIISGIETIERENRFFVWRIIEYILLIFRWIQHYYLGKPLINYSIGKYQLKLNLILSDLLIEYEINKKQIIIPNKIPIRVLLALIYRANNYYCIEGILKSKFDFNWNKLQTKQIEELSHYYSRNIEFKGDFNYFSILRMLYNQEFEEIFEEANNFS